MRCHQCRFEWPISVTIPCNNTLKPKPGKKIDNPNEAEGYGLCTLSYCSRCVLHRYGDEISKLRASGSWICPACLDYCNCSTCRKKKGLPPTGRLGKMASEGGYSSVRELLEVNPKAQVNYIINTSNQKIQTKKLDSNKATTISKPKKLDSNKATTISKPKKALPSSNVNSASNIKESSKPVKSSNKAKISNKTVEKKKPESIKKKKSEIALKNPKTSKDEKFKNSDESSKSFTKVQKVSSNPTRDFEFSKGLEQVSKLATKRGPKTVLPPKSISCFPSGKLTSEQIKLRLHIREFVCRFKNLLPGLGATEALNSKTETQRSEKLIDSMDDLVNFWIDDEGGMRAIGAGLIRLIESEIDDEDNKEDSIIKSSESRSLLLQLKKEFRIGFVSPSPYSTSSSQCWQSKFSMIFLERECPNSQLMELSDQSAYISDDVDDERLERIKFPPEKKMFIIGGLIDVALRGSAIAEDLIQGLERERQTRADIVKERVRLNKQWAETKASKIALMPRKMALPADTKDKAPTDEESEEAIAAAKALSEWEADMNQAEKDHKDELRLLSINQYITGSANRLRFQEIGQDTKENVYYILSGTPGRLYPPESLELLYAWSYSVVINGRDPNDFISIPKKSKKRADYEAKVKKEDEEEMKDENDEMVDMLEGGERETDDQWIRVSDPKDIRQLASWIEYEARMIDFQQEEAQPAQKTTKSSNGNSSSITNGNIKHSEMNVNGKNDSIKNINSTEPPTVVGRSQKSVAGLVEQIQLFAEYIELKIKEKEEQAEKKRQSDRRTGRLTRA
ncbi:zinc-finger domain of monoamine-oxidase A repressor R1-domain-containing protein [Phakopsora pachyrhizi]|uniref:Zinc-finger domain of monoamine-oxidase A repressor R1-domain-containing protein n=1 Tax=Phakopsora pachyrhizi TaxID=170000 RepID=A0AAV0BTA7_PHAPC|nr:zinc-finger domain of monoamine-oxidase A repressor R1-domain-containing protein [Phakopsora pachyrhizi]CAH7689357.1 zinc-finger domain of monoamine-oxidase A repressor R1-domain-containing protein [Phakopsora pachyrhizi]